MSDVRKRWRTPAGQQLAQAAALALVNGDALGSLGIGEHGGRTDLRGLWLSSLHGLPRDVRWSGLQLSGRQLRRLDLSGAEIAIHCEDATVSDVRCDRALWSGWQVSASTFVGCSFVGTDLRDSRLDSPNPGLQRDGPPARTSRYIDCDFTRTRIGGPFCDLGRATFERCRFNGTKFASPMWFRGASLVDCVFEGAFREVLFGWTGPIREEAPRLHRVDVTRAQFTTLAVYAVSGSGLMGAPGQDPASGAGPLHDPSRR